MTLTIEMISNYLGEDSSVLVSSHPFNNWVYERTVDNDLETPRYDYVFNKNGMDFVSDENNRVGSIYLYFGEDRCFEERIKNLSVNMSRKDIIGFFGSPSQSGDGFIDPILGEYGAWDRFALSGYSIHFEYSPRTEILAKVTLMREDVVP